MLVIMAVAVQKTVIDAKDGRGFKVYRRLGEMEMKVLKEG
jgi:hypothetical protein